MEKRCSPENLKLIPLHRAVNAAIVDSYEDIGRTQQRYTHWGARCLKKLNRQTLKTGKRYATLTVNRSTNTATLPADFNEEFFVGVIDEYGEKIALKIRNEITNTKSIEDIECEDKCERCSQDKAICNDLTVTESTSLVTINDSIYEQTVVKKLYPNGDYYLETKIPMWDVTAFTVVYTTTKEFVAKIDLKPCGCIDDTPANIETIRCCCPDVYNCYYAPCDSSCSVDYGGYRIFEETGLIQFDTVGKFSKVYIEYWGFVPKKNGQYQVPEVAFETIVEWIKFMAIDGKRNVPNVDKQWRWKRYVIERANMEKELGRISLSQIIHAIGLTPKFDIDYPALRGGCLATPKEIITATVADDICDEAPVCCPPVVGSTSAYTPFSISTIAGNGPGSPTPGTNTFQDNRLKGALNVNMIVVNNTNETIAALQFTLNTTTGVIERFQSDGVTPNVWQIGDILIVPTYFKLV